MNKQTEAVLSGEDKSKACSFAFFLPVERLVTVVNFLFTNPVVQGRRPKAGR